MKVIVTYDISDVKLQSKVRDTLRRYINHIQFSVFEGTLTPALVKKLILELKSFEKYLGEKDGILVFKIYIESKIEKEIIGPKGRSIGSNIL